MYEFASHISGVIVCLKMVTMNFFILNQSFIHKSCITLVHNITQLHLSEDDWSILNSQLPLSLNYCEAVYLFSYLVSMELAKALKL